MQQTADVAVIGIGGIGSAVLAELGRRGVKAVGIDRFAPPHDRGSSHGRTRLIRTAYFEHADYVPLLVEAFRGWERLEAETGLDLYTETGLLEVGPADGAVVPGVLAAADVHDLAVDQLTTDDLRGGFPWFRFTDDQVGVFERRAGVLRVETAIEASLSMAARAGGHIRTDERVLSLRPSGGGWTIQTQRSVLEVGAVVVTTGAWAAPLLAEHLASAPPLRIRRKSLFWFGTEQPRLQDGPAFFFELPHGQFYGFPTDDLGLKVAEHSGGAEIGDPLAVSRAIDPDELDRLAGFVSRHMPDVGSDVLAHETCLYTMTPDEHFIVDALPNGSYAAGLSGHGFKFAPVLATALADLALTGHTDLPIGFLSMDRFA